MPQVSLHSVWCWGSLVLYYYDYIVVCLLFPEILLNFYQKWVLGLVEGPSSSNELITWLLSLSLFIWWIVFIDLHAWKHPCISGMELAWFQWVIFLMSFWTLFANILLRAFVSLSIRKTSLWFSPCCVFIWFKHQCNAGFIRGVWKQALPSIVWNTF